MKKIVITGALGYIGTELCKLYSGFSWKYEVVAIDSDEMFSNYLYKSSTTKSFRDHFAVASKKVYQWF